MVVLFQNWWSFTWELNLHLPSSWSLDFIIALPETDRFVYASVPKPDSETRMQAKRYRTLVRYTLLSDISSPSTLVFRDPNRQNTHQKPTFPDDRGLVVDVDAMKPLLSESDSIYGSLDSSGFPSVGFLSHGTSNLKSGTENHFSRRFALKCPNKLLFTTTLSFCLWFVDFNRVFELTYWR